jgi:uncharacterized protein (TIGR00251 family)
VRPAEAAFFRAEPDGVSIRLRVQPKARAAGFHGVADSGDGPRLRLSVTAPADDGAANRAVVAALATALQLAPSAVSLVHGARGREKTLRAVGDPARLGAVLARLGVSA